MVLAWSLLFFIALFHGSSVGWTEQLSGLWMMPRMDASNKARSDVTGDMRTEPVEIWRMATGGEVGYAHAVQLPHGKEAALILAGTNLELKDWDGFTIWRLTREDARRILHVGDFDGDGAPEAMVLCSTRQVALYDLETGVRRWSWQAPLSSSIGNSQFYTTYSGIRFITFPIYSVKGFCFDFSGSRDNPVVVWEQDYAGKYTTGYGPGIVLKDMDSDGKPDIVLSSKYCEHPEGKTCFHAVIDIDSGEIRHDVYSVPDKEAPLDLGRPYGLLHAVKLDGDCFPDVVLVSCQVEEFATASRNVGGSSLEPLWGKFIEKDWPVDDRELRPQVTSLSDVNGDSIVELVVGLWDSTGWRTAIVDPKSGFDAEHTALKGMYFWGCHDITGDGVPEIIVSAETKRKPARAAALHAFDGSSLKSIATLEDAAVFTSADSDLPSDTVFNAIRSNPVSVTRDDGTTGILVRRFREKEETGVFLWGGRPGETIQAHQVAGEGFVRIDYHDNVLLFTDRAGRIQRFDLRLCAIGNRLATVGRSCQPLVWSVDGVRDLVVPMAGGTIVGGIPDLEGGSGFTIHWQVSGAMHALHIDGMGASRLAVADTEDPDHPAVVVHPRSTAVGTVPVRIALQYPPYIGIIPFGDDYRLLVNLQTGVHTNSFACYDGAGNLLWESPDHGAHPRLPAVFDLDGDRSPEVIADDHGELRVYDSTGRLVCGDYGKGFIPPAYVLPVVDRFRPGGEVRILGASGFGGMSLRTADARLLWKLGDTEYRYYWGLGAMGDVDGSGELRLGIMTEDGALECIDVEAGSVRWAVDLGMNGGVGSVVSADVDGDGCDEFLAGLPDGRLVAVEEREMSRGAVLWEKRFDAAVTAAIFADVDGDGKGEIVISTSDGYVRILR